MKRILFIAVGLLLVGFGCTKTDPNVQTHKDAAGGFAFNYPTANWSLKHEYTQPGEPNNPDDGITQAAFNNTSVILFHPVRDAQNAQDAVMQIAILKMPGSVLLDSGRGNRDGLTQVTTKKGTIEYTWMVLALPKHESYLVLELKEVFTQPYPAGLEVGVEMILNSVREL